jgi:uncharacterized protein
MMLLLAALTVRAALAAAPDAYVAETETWRADREARLKSEYGWLSVAGLFWLPPGVSTFGSDPASTIVLPPSAPPHAGAFERQGDSVTVRIEPGGATALAPDSTPLTLGQLRLQLIKRGDRLGVRLRDPESPIRRDFKGLHWFPVDQRFRVAARWVAYDKPRRLPVGNVLGQVTEEVAPGYAELELGGRTVRLTPVYEDGDETQLFFIFRDPTAPRLTYGGGRFLYADPPRNGHVILDFNRAYNPPCAFNPYTTCPLPPKENRLGVEIPAGEKKYEH